MNKNDLLVLAMAVALLAPAKGLCADETTQTVPVAVATSAQAVTEVPPLADANEESLSGPVNEKLEFVSGEISVVDAVAKSVAIKLYGETENNTTDKTLTVSTDASTDITDGEKDRDLASLAAGTEVDVEYDPTTNKATYIFVY